MEPGSRQPQERLPARPRRAGRPRRRGTPAGRLTAAGPAGWLALAAILAGCGGADRPGPDAGGGAAPAGSAAGSSAASGGQPAGPPARRILFLGTSLTAGYGLEPHQAYPALIQQKLDSAGLRYEVINAGVSGETSAGALRRVSWLMRDPPQVLVVETGANDGLRGQDPDSVRANIQAIIDSARAHRPDMTILLAQMEAPRNLGPMYVRRFRSLFADLARANGLILVPFLLDGVATVDSLNQADGIHPTAAGQRVVAANVWRVLAGALRNGR